MNKGFTVESVLVRCSSMVDGGMSVGFHTKELNTKEKAEVMEFHNKTGWLLFRENEVDEGEIPQQDAEFETKTPSQRLRAVLFVLWKQSNGEGRFEDFYTAKMESLIEAVKRKLE